MSVDLKTPSDASMTELVSGILHDVQDLVKQQTELLKHEVRTGLRKTLEASLLFVAGAGLAVAGVILMAFMLAHLLQWAVPALPLWACYGVMGFVLLSSGAGLFYAGKLLFESFTTLPKETIQALKEDVQWIANRK
jgi:Flp pilus assembly protein TadB